MKDIILGNSELSLAVEGRFTNLRIWKTKNSETIYFRLDKFNDYSAPLSEGSLGFLDKPNENLNKLNELFSFNGATVKDIDTIIEIVKDMKIRACRDW